MLLPYFSKLTTVVISRRMHSKCLRTWNVYIVIAALILLPQGFTVEQTATGSSCVASGASTEGVEQRNSSGSPTPAPTPAPTPIGSGCRVANCVACRGAPTNCYLCKPVGPRRCSQRRAPHVLLSWQLSRGDPLRKLNSSGTLQRPYNVQCMCRVSMARLRCPIS